MGAIRQGERVLREGVLCVGTVVVDVGKVVDHYPERDHLALVEEIHTSTGGPGLNLAVDLRRLGATYPVGIVGVTGDDSHADFLIAALTELDIDTAAVRRAKGAHTSFTDVIVERHGGRRTFFHHPGANDLLTADDVDLANTTARILHVGAPGVHSALDAAMDDGSNGWAQLLGRARAAGLHTNLELVDLPPERQRELVGPCLPHLDSIIVNEIEASTLTGARVEAPGVDEVLDWEVSDWTAMQRVALDLIGLGVRRLAVVHFPGGCVAAASDGTTWAHGSVLVPPAEVRSTTGAGDAVAAGVLHGIHAGWSTEASLRLGMAAAAACVRGVNTSDGILPADECLALADGYGYRPVGHRSEPS